MYKKRIQRIPRNKKKSEHERDLKAERYYLKDREREREFNKRDGQGKKNVLKKKDWIRYIEYE